MSNLAYKGDDYPDAAAKHLDDSKALLAAQRFDGAGYLAGYVLECSLKTILLVEGIAKNAGLTPGTLKKGLTQGNTVQKNISGPAARARNLSHQLNDISKEALRFASFRSGAQPPYRLDPSSYAACAKGWRETIRYQKRGDVKPAEATQWVTEAEKLYEATVGEMFRNGVVVF